MKVCFECSIKKPLCEFYTHKKSKDGHVNKCKDCTKKDVHANRLKNIEIIREYDRNTPNKAERAKKSHEYDKTEKGKQVRFKATRAYRSANPERYYANSAVNNAVRDGRLIRPNECSCCGEKCKPHGHHNDYSKPLDVIWYCNKCHNQYHLFIRELWRNLKDTGIENPFPNEYEK